MTWINTPAGSTMKRLIFTTLATAIISNNILAADKLNTYPFDKIYMNLGGGFIETTHDSSTITNSNTQLISFNGTPPGLFNLQNVDWRNTLNNGFEINLALGGNFCFCPKWRAEGEFLYQNIRREISGHYNWIQVDSGGGDVITPIAGNHISFTDKTLNVYALMANIYYDFKTYCKWTPYLGAGLGFARIKSTSSQANDSLLIIDESAGTGGFLATTENSPYITSSVLAWQFKAGIGYEFDEHFSVLGQYRLFGTSSYNTSSSTILINSTSAVPVIFNVPGGTARGLLNNGFDLSFKYTL